MKTRGPTIFVLTSLLTVPQALHAQLPDPSARSVGVAGAYSARARGYEAPFWNAANLGLPEGPGFSVGLPAATASLANNSLSYGEIEALYGEFLDDQQKSDLLADIRREDPDRRFELAAGAGAHWIAFSIGRFALGAGTHGGGLAEVSPDGLELLLFGNVGEDGGGNDFQLDGSNGLVWGASSAFLSYGHPLSFSGLEMIGAHLSVGATFKYTVAHGLVRLQDQGSFLTAEPLAANVEAELLNSTSLESGRGWSFDLGAAMDWNDLTLGLSVRNVLHDLSWSEEEFELTLISATADFDSTASNDTTIAFADLSEDDQARVVDFLDEAGYPTRIQLGAHYRLNRQLGFSADYRESVGGVLTTEWDRSLSLGAEANLIGVLPLRLGAATNFRDIAYAGGAGLYIGPVHFDASLIRRGLPGGDGLGAALSISVWPGTWH